MTSWSGEYRHFNIAGGLFDGSHSCGRLAGVVKGCDDLIRVIIVDYQDETCAHVEGGTGFVHVEVCLPP